MPEECMRQDPIIEWVHVSQNSVHAQDKRFRFWSEDVDYISSISRLAPGCSVLSVSTSSDSTSFGNVNSRHIFHKYKPTRIVYIQLFFNSGSIHKPCLRLSGLNSGLAIAYHALLIACWSDDDGLSPVLCLFLPQDEREPLPSVEIEIFFLNVCPLNGSF